MRNLNDNRWDVADDEVDRLFARLQSVEPPPAFVASVLSQVSPAARPVEAIPVRSAAATLAWLALQVLGALAVGLAAYWLGQAFWTSGAYDLLALLRDDSDLLSAYGDAYWTALAATLPWLQLGVVALALTLTALTWVYSRPLLRLFADDGARRAAR